LPRTTFRERLSLHWSLQSENWWF